MLIPALLQMLGRGDPNALAQLKSLCPGRVSLDHPNGLCPPPPTHPIPKLYSGIINS